MISLRKILGAARFDKIADGIIRRARRRPADFVIGGFDNPYMVRWWLTFWSGLYRGLTQHHRTWWQRALTLLPGAYLHRICRSDDDRALHDHPWWNVSIVLKGSYTEHTIAAGGIHTRHRRVAGDVVFRRARRAHRIEIDMGACWSLFITGPRLRNWGFHSPDAGWVPWQQFTAESDAGAIGKGCNQ